MNAAVDELYSLLIPLSDRRLLVPRACVAEVVSLNEQETEPDDRDWHMGVTRWNGRQVPVVSFEGCCGDAIPDAGRRSRIVIFHAIAGKVQSGFFGIVSQGFPQLVRVSPEVLKVDENQTTDDRTPVLCHVQMANEFPLIPDLEMLEATIAGN